MGLETRLREAGFILAGERLDRQDISRTAHLGERSATLCHQKRPYSLVIEPKTSRKEHFPPDYWNSA